MQPRHYRWRVTLPSGERFDLHELPEPTRAMLEARYPGATVEPLPDHDQQAEQTVPPELEARIRAMAERWGYPADDLEIALQGAARDPRGWTDLVDDDERRLAPMSPGC